MARAMMGEDQKAIDDYTAAIQVDPQKPLAYHNRGLLHGDREEYDAAIRDFSEAIRRDPKYGEAFNSRGYVYFLKKQPAQAVADFTEAIRLNPQFPLAHNNRGFNQQLQGKYAEALADYEQALQLAPQYLMALRNKAWLLATCPEDKIRNGQKALETAQRCWELGQGKHRSDAKALAAAQAELGQFADAVKWQTQALELTPPDQHEQVKQEQELLTLYKSNKPFRLTVK
jgi:tetratricopeptide (TPR) repeat protein